MQESNIAVFAVDIWSKGVYTCNNILLRDVIASGAVLIVLCELAYWFKNPLQYERIHLFLIDISMGECIQIVSRALSHF